MIELVVGGARSGKSKYALELAEKSGLLLNFVATAEMGDRAMNARIERHKQERSAEWLLTEEPLKLSALVSKFDSGDTVVVDCLTLWLSNWLCGHNIDAWLKEKQQFLAAVKSSKAYWIMISNETGMGIIPMGELSRDFVDHSGWFHQELAKMADHVTFVMLGIPQKLK